MTKTLVSALALATALVAQPAHAQSYSVPPAAQAKAEAAACLATEYWAGARQAEAMDHCFGRTFEWRTACLHDGASPAMCGVELRELVRGIFRPVQTATAASPKPAAAKLVAPPTVVVNVNVTPAPAPAAQHEPVAPPVAPRETVAMPAPARPEPVPERNVQEQSWTVPEHHETPAARPAPAPEPDPGFEQTFKHNDGVKLAEPPKPAAHPAPAPAAWSPTSPPLPALTHNDGVKPVEPKPVEPKPATVASPAAHHAPVHWYAAHLGPDVCVPVEDIGSDGQRVYYGSGQLSTPEDVVNVLRNLGEDVQLDPKNTDDNMVVYIDRLPGQTPHDFAFFKIKAECEDMMAMLRR